MQSVLPDVCTRCGLYTSRSSQSHSRLEPAWFLRGNASTQAVDILLLVDGPTYGDAQLNLLGGGGEYSKIKEMFSKAFPQCNIAIAAAVRCLGKSTKIQQKGCFGLSSDFVRQTPLVLGLGSIPYQMLFGGSKAGRNVWLQIDKIPGASGYFTSIPSIYELSVDPGLLVYVEAAVRILRNHLTGHTDLIRYVDSDKRFQGTNYVAVSKEADFVKAVDYLAGFDVLAYDIETTGLSPYDGVTERSFDNKEQRLLSLAVAYAPGRAVCFLLHHKDNPDRGAPYIYREMRRLFSLPNKQWAAHNGKFDSGWLRVHLGLDVFTYWDTMLMHGTFDENTPHVLKLLAKLYTDMGQYDNDLDKYLPAKKQMGYAAFEKVPVDLLMKYNAADADVTLRLVHIFKECLRSEKLLAYYKTLVQHDNWATGITEANGVYVDEARIAEVRGVLLPKIEELRNRVNGHELLRRYAALKERSYVQAGMLLWHDNKLYRNSQDVEQGLVLYDPKVERLNEYQHTTHTWLVDRKVLYKGGAKVGQPYKSRIYTLDQCRVNLSAPEDLRTLLYDNRFLGLVITERTKKSKKGSTDKNTLNGLASTVPFVKELLEYRNTLKTYNTYNARYVRGQVDIVNEKGQVSKKRGYIHDDGFMHPVFLITGGNDYDADYEGGDDSSLGGTRTRRKSAIDPNVTNQPKRGPNAKYVQSYYTSRYGDDGVLVQFDYSQLELRVFAINAQALFMLDAYNRGLDLHLELAAEAFGDRYVEAVSPLLQGLPIAQSLYDDTPTVWKTIHTGVLSELSVSMQVPLPSLEEVYGIGDKLRSKIKPAYFGMLYSAGEETVARAMELDVETVSGIMRRVFDKIPEYKLYKDMVERNLSRDGFVMSMVGAVRHLPTCKSSDSGIVAKALRQAGNFYIQNAGSEMLTASWILLQRWLAATGLNRYIHHVLSVHDSFLLDCHKKYAPYVFHGVPTIMENLHETPCGNFAFLNRERMERIGKITCPIKVDCVVGPSWASLNKLTEHHDWCGGIPANMYVDYAEAKEVLAARDILQTLVRYE